LQYLITIKNLSMTHLAIKGNIAQQQIDVMLGMLKSWNIDAEIMDRSIQANATTRRRTAAKQAKGFLHKYANEALIKKEKSAWANHVKEKYENI